MELNRENIMAILLTLLVLFVGIWVIYRTITSTFNESGCKFSGDRYVYANNTNPNECGKGGSSGSGGSGSGGNGGTPPPTTPAPPAPPAPPPGGDPPKP